MKLTEYEKDMLNGVHGQAKQMAMNIMVEVGEPLGAEEFVEVVSVQDMAHFGSLHIAGRDFLKKLADMGGEVVVPTTQDPASIPLATWEEMGYNKNYAKNQLSLCDSVKRLGEWCGWSCTPYVQGNLPRFGQNVAWAESSAVSYANSVLGAKTNRTPAGLTVCAALTGRIPKFGLYYDKNRKAEVKVNIDAGELTEKDYNSIGIILGKKVGNRIPALYGIPESASNEELKYLGACAASSGSVALWHAVGVTPEAIDRDPFLGDKPIREFTITREMIKETEDSLSTVSDYDADLYVTGCPHSSIQEIIYISKLMENRRVKKGKEIWIFTTAEANNMLKEAGIIKKLEDSGVRMMVQTCLVISPFIAKGKYNTLATDSGKFASYLPSEHGIDVVFGSKEECINLVTEEKR